MLPGLGWNPLMRLSYTNDRNAPPSFQWRLPLRLPANLWMKGGCWHGPFLLYLHHIHFSWYIPSMNLFALGINWFYVAWGNETPHVLAWNMSWQSLDSKSSLWVGLVRLKLELQEDSVRVPSWSTLWLVFSVFVIFLLNKLSCHDLVSSFFGWGKYIRDKK